jgi:hypothetical protein
VHLRLRNIFCRLQGIQNKRPNCVCLLLLHTSFPFLFVSSAVLSFSSSLFFGLSILFTFSYFPPPPLQSPVPLLRIPLFIVFFSTF